MVMIFLYIAIFKYGNDMHKWGVLLRSMVQIAYITKIFLYKRKNIFIY